MPHHPFDFPPFLPPFWLRNAHVQTVLAARRPRRWDYGWENWEPVAFDLGKDGMILAEASWRPGNREDSPVLFLLHGLEGSAQSHYLIGISKKAFRAGFHTVRVNTRNCGGTEHLTPTLYCAGLSQDVLTIAEHLRRRMGIDRIYAAGISLGANILLKFLGEQGNRGPEYVRGAAVLSPPVDLASCAARMEEPQNRFYQRYFVRRLVNRMRRKLALFPSMGDMERIKRVRTIREFDDVVTAPHFGFDDADDYYRLASSAPLLRKIQVPTLIVQSKDDPFIPFETFEASGIEANPHLTLVATEHGGHTGFLGTGPFGSDDLDGYWAESRIVQYMTALASLK